MRAEVRHVAGLSFVGKADSNHWVAMDGPTAFGGAEAGSKPMELILIALGGCTGMDVVSLLKKMRVEFSDFKVEISAEKKEEHPKTFTKVHIRYIIKSTAPKEKIEKAVELSQKKYCSVSAILRQSAEVTYEIVVLPPGEG